MASALVEYAVELVQIPQRLMTRKALDLATLQRLARSRQPRPTNPYKASTVAVSSIRPAITRAECARPMRGPADDRQRRMHRPAGARFRLAAAAPAREPPQWTI